ncbi:mCG1038218, isoform CRA_c, partial [Mus musculus]
SYVFGIFTDGFPSRVYSITCLCQPFVWFCDQCPVSIILRTYVYVDLYNSGTRWLNRKLFNEKENMFSVVIHYKRK